MRGAARAGFGRDSLRADQRYEFYLLSDLDVRFQPFQSLHPLPPLVAEFRDGSCFGLAAGLALRDSLPFPLFSFFCFIQLPPCSGASAPGAAVGLQERVCG